MKKIGDGLRGRREMDWSLFAEIMEWYEDMLAEVYLRALPVVERRISAATTRLDLLSVGPQVDYSSRVKTVGTIVDKLERQGTGLDRIQDFAGARLDLDCGISAQRAVAEDLLSEFTSDNTKVKWQDHLVNDQHGYRAIHLHITAPAGRVELQIRSHTQAKWANAYELLADRFGRHIRYEEPPFGPLPEDDPFLLARDMQSLSTALYEREIRTEHVHKVAMRSLQHSKVSPSTALIEYAQMTQEQREVVVALVQRLVEAVEKVRG